jgi:hypothetical protein
LTILAVLLGVAALTQPLWAFQRDRGDGDVDKSSYGWTSLVVDEWRSGVLARTTVTPYASPTFDQFRMREAARVSYLIGVLYLVLLLLLGAIHRNPNRVPAMAAHIAGLCAFLVAMFALVYPVATIGTAAAFDVNPAVTGFFGSATVGGDRLAWGPGVAWWLWAASAIPVFAVFVLSILQGRSVRGPATDRTRG